MLFLKKAVKKERSLLMKTKYDYIIFLSITFIFLYVSTGFSFDKKFDIALAKPLKTEKAELSEIDGIFKLILYGARYSDDIETVAILDYEGDQYEIKPFAPDFDFRIKKEVPAKEAVKEAIKFISFHNSFHKYSLKRIIDNKGYTVGFEFRPLYYPSIYGLSDVMDIDYWLKEKGKIKATIRLIPSVERLRLQGGREEAGNCGD